MTFKDYYRSLTRAQRDQLAARAGTTRQYIEKNVLSALRHKRVPRWDLLHDLHLACDGNVPFLSVLATIFPKVQEELDAAGASMLLHMMAEQSRHGRLDGRGERDKAA